MYISITKSKNFEFVYTIKNFYNNNFHTTKIYKKLGTIKKKNDNCDTISI